MAKHEQKQHKIAPGQAMEIFVEDIMEEKGFENLEPEILLEIKKDLLSRLEDYINIAVLDHMPEDKIEEFDKLLDQDDPIAVQNFCQKYIPDLQNFVTQAMANFRSSYLGLETK